MPQEQIGLSAMGLNRDFKQISVYVYQVVFDSCFDVEDDPIPLTRKAARFSAACNGWWPVTDIDAFQLVSVKPLTQLYIDQYGMIFRLNPQNQINLCADNEPERSAIERLLNQDIYAGAYTLSNKSGRALRVQRGVSGWTELEENQPSERIKGPFEYLDLYQTLRITPELLPNGQVILGLSLRHKICAKDGVTLDWVINNRPDWLQHIKRVRHNYKVDGKPAVIADYLSIANDKSTESEVPGLGQSFYSYHDSKGNIKPGHQDRVRRSHVVTVSYGSRKEFTHIAALLEPMFDFETLQKIDSPLLNKIARNLKWPMQERLRTSGKIIRGLTLPAFDCHVITASPENHTAENIKPAFNFQFYQGRTGTSEKEVLKKKAFKGMSCKSVVCIAVGSQASSDSLSYHFRKLDSACLALSPVTPDAPVWKGTKKVSSVSNAEELDARLSQSPQESTLLVIAIDKNVSKSEIRDVAFRHGLPCQFMLTDHSPKTYVTNYYNNLAAGVFSKGGGLICSLDGLPGDVDLFIGLDMGGVSQRAPGSAFLFTRNGAQLGWQLADMQQGERLEDSALADLLKKSIAEYTRKHNGCSPKTIVLHRDGRFFESMDVIKAAEHQYGLTINVLEVIKSGAPVLFRKSQHKGDRQFHNPEVGDIYRYPGLDEMIVATYGGSELGAWGQKVSIRPLRLRKRYGKLSLDTLAQQVLLLSRIHGASLYRHPRLPVTTHHADRFATLRQECCLEALSHMDRTCPVYL